MKRLSPVVIAGLLTFTSTTVFAEKTEAVAKTPNKPVTTTPYSGPSINADITVKQLLATGVKDQVVTLTGKIVRHTGGENYIFADETGEIKTEIDKKYFPAQPTINEHTKVKIVGEYEKIHFKKNEVEVKQMIVVLN